MFETLLTTRIEIAAPPAEVRTKFLQFDQIPKYHPKTFFKSIGPAVPNAPLEVGSKLHVVIVGGDFEPVLLENSPTTFCWEGRGLLGTFVGRHIFRFAESETAKGATTFIQEENFSGLSAFLIGDGAVGAMVGLNEKTRKGHERYNTDFKKWVEGGK